MGPHHFVIAGSWMAKIFWMMGSVKRSLILVTFQALPVWVGLRILETVRVLGPV